MLTVTLVEHEIRMAANVGLERALIALVKKSKGYNAAQSPHHMRWYNDIEGAAAECAAAKGLKMFWNGSYNTFHEPDIGERIQVRSTEEREDPEHPGKLKPISLIVRPDQDRSNDIYFLVIGKIPTFTIEGWMPGRDAMKEQYLRRPNKGPWAWFVPREELYPVEEFKGEDSVEIVYSWD